MQFIQNKGQWRADDLYRASTSVSTVQIMQHGFMLSVLDKEKVAESAKLSNEIEEAQAHGLPVPTRDVMIPQQAWMIEFIGMNPSAIIQNRGKQTAYYNYFLGSDKTKWASNVASFGEVWYNNVYDKVNFRIYTGADNSVEYDIIAYPGANISAIQLRHTGLNGMSVNEKGELVTKTIFGNITYPRPATYQTVNGKNVPVECAYMLTDGNILGFKVGAHDNTLPVVIDPVALRWAVYVSNADNGTTGHNHGIEVDAAGAIYVTGRSSATNFPITAGVIQTTNKGANDGFITKLNQAVNVGDAGSLAWSTYIGGSGSENIYAIKLDAAGNIYITGSTPSTNYPTTVGAYQTANGGGTDAVVSKVNNSGTSLLYSTYIGGANTDQANFIYVNAAGEAFIAGNALAGFPTTAGAYQTAFGGGAGTGDAFWCKLNAAGSSLLYSTYYGGTGNDQFTCLRPSGANDIILVGVTTSAASIATAGAYKTSVVGSNNNGMVVKFSVSPSISRTWATYINPAAAADNVTLLCQQVDNSGNVYIGGTTNGIAASALTTGAYQGTIGGGTDIYIGKLSAAGDSIKAGTYVGGSGNETPIMGLNIDNFGSVYALGYTTSTNLVTTVDALQSANKGGIDAMVMKMSPDLTQMKYLSYWGGTSDDTDPVGYDGVKFSNCRFYTALTTFSNNAPMSANAYQATRTSPTTVDEPAVAVWSNPPDVTSDTIMGNENVCAGTAPSLDITGSATAYVLAGINRGGTISSQTAQPITYVWQKSTDLVTWTTIAGATGQSLTSAQIGTLTVTTYFQRVIGADFCTGGTIVTKTVTNIAVPTGSEANGGVICRGGTIKLSVTGTGGAVFNWMGPNTYSATGSSQTITNAQVINGGNYIVTQTVGTCTSPPDTVPTSIVNCPPNLIHENGTAPSTGGTPIANVTSNDSIIGSPAVIGTNATLSQSGIWPTGITLNTSTGAIVVAGGTAPGVYPVVYQLCDMQSPVNCSTVTDTITVTPNINPHTENGTAPSTGGTAITNVANNDSVDGTPAVIGTNATVSQSGTWPAGITLNTTTGDIVVAGGTAPGVYPVVYQLCDKQTPANCATVTDNITVTSNINPITDNGSAPSTGGTAITNVASNDSVDGTPAVIGTNATVSQSGSWPAGVTLNTTTGDIVVAGGTTPGIYPVVYQLCDMQTPANCATVTDNITVTSNINPITDNGTAPSTGGTAITNVASNDSVDGTPAVIGTNATVSQSGSWPAGVTLNTTTGDIVVAGGTTPGIYPVVYQLCDMQTPANCATVTDTITVTSNINPITDNGTAPSTGGTAITNVASNDSVDGTPAVIGTNATVSQSGSWPAGVTLNTTTGDIVVAGGTTPGIYPVVYQLCDMQTPANCATVTDNITVTSNINPITDNGTAPSTGGTAITNVASNDSVDGTPAIIGTNATVSQSGSWPAGIALNSSTGVVTVAGGTTPGVYPVVYQLCDMQTPVNCATVTDNITVTSNINPITDNGTAPSTGGTAITNVASNDSVDGTPAVIGTNATVNQSGTWPAGVTLNTTTGDIVVAGGTAPGVYPVVYELCDMQTPANCATVTDNITVTSNINPITDNGTAPSTGGTAITNVASNDSVDGAPAVIGTNATVSQSGTWPAGVTLNTTTGDIVVAGGTTPGIYPVVYQLCDMQTPANCATVTDNITVTSNINPITDNGTAPSTGGTAITNVASNDSVDGTPAVIGTNATVSQSGSWPAGVTLNTTTGDIVVAGGTAPGVYPVVYQLCDMQTPANCATVTDNITVTSNINPITDNGTAPSTGGTAITNVASNDSVDGTPAIIGTNATVSQSGTWPAGVTLNTLTGAITVAGGTLPGIYPVVYQLCDNQTPANCATVTDTVTVTPAIKPVYETGGAPSTGGTAITNVASNDSVDGTPAIIGTNATVSQSGTWPAGVTLNTTTGDIVVAGGTTPGIYPVVYQLCDMQTPANCATVTDNITITSNINPITDNGTAPSTGGTAITNVASNDSVDGTPAVIGTNATVSQSGTWPAGVTLNTTTGDIVVAGGTTPGIYPVVYQLCDMQTPANCATVTDTVTVTPVIKPVYETGGAPSTGGTAITNVASNDSVDGTPAVIGTNATVSQSGTWPAGVTLNTSTGDIVVAGGTTPGIYPVVYQLCDMQTPANCATVTDTVTVTPVIKPVYETGGAPSTSGTAITNVASNDSVDGTPAVIGTNATVSQSGTWPAGVTLNTSTGAVTVAPGTTPGFYTVVYQLCDMQTPPNCATVADTVTVTNVNQPPVAVNDAATTHENTTLNGTVAANDSITDGPSAIFSINTNPSHGTVVLNPNGTYTYTPTANFSGVDTFSYILCDGGTPNLCDTAIVVITVLHVNQAPIAVNDTATTPEDTPLSGNVSTNDNFTDGPFALYTLSTPPSHGSVVFTFNGSYVYTPGANFDGTDSFSYIVCDGGSPNLCDTATVYITVTPVNDAPIANDDNNSTAVNTTLTGTVASNDHDVDGPGAIYSVTDSASHGTLVLNSNGTYTYTPDSNYVGCDTMIVSLCDGGTPNLCDTSLLIICVTSGNHAPIAVNDTAQTQINTNVIIHVLANDSDPDGNLSSVPTVLNNPQHGTATVNSDGTITYTPANGFAGSDTFSYVICDGGVPVMCDTALVFVTVVSPPVINGVPLVTQTDSAINTCISYTLNNYNYAPTVSVTCSPQHGTVVVTVDSVNHQLCITYTPDSNYYGQDTFCITLCDGSDGLCTTATIPVTVNSKNQTCYWLKGISPNGDGQNDNFYINCNDAYPNSTLKVFNRWGDQVWDSQGHYTNNFEGKNGRGDVLPDGTYYYIYYYNDGSGGEHGGFIQVTR